MTLSFVLAWIAGAASGFAGALVWVRLRVDRELTRRDELELAAAERWQQQYDLQRQS